MHSGSRDLSFLSGGGNTARLIAGFDWSATSLGHIGSWPQSLRTTCSLMLRSPVPIVTLWGEDGIMIYNDAYSVFAGGRHPVLLGSKVREGWPEVADFNDHVMKVGLAGQTLAYQDQELTLHRHGAPEQVWMNLDYSPVLDETGKPAGVIAIVVETTAKVRAERRLTGERERLQQMFQQAPGFVATMAGPDHVFEIANDAYFQLVGHRDIIGKPIGEALPEIGEQGFIELLDNVYRTREPFVGQGALVRLQRQPGAAFEERYLDFVYQPVFDDTGNVTGIFVQGQDVTDRKLAEGALRESEARFRLIAENAPVMLWMGNEIGGCVYLNAAKRAFWGVAEADFSSFDWNTTVHPEDRAALAAAVAPAMAEHRPFQAEARYRNADGVYRLLHTDARPRFDVNGLFAGMIGVNVDVTKTRLEETRRLALIELNDRFRELEQPVDLAYAAAEILGKALNVSRAGYGTIDPVAETITIERDWNAPGIKTLAGILHFRDYGSYIENLKRGETVVFADAEKDPRTAATAEALKAISAVSVVNMPVTEQGGIVALLYLNNATSRDWNPQELAFIREVAERTRTAVERRRAEQELQDLANSLERQVTQRTAELARVWRNSQDILVILTKGGIVQAVNPALTSILGHRRKDVVEHSILDFVWPDDLDLTIQALQQPESFSDLKRFESRYRHRNGSYRWISWRLSFEDNQVFAYGRDVSAEKEQTAALRQTEEQLRQSQKMEAIGQLTGGIAHDFNNLLQVVSGNLQLLSKDVAGNERARQRIDNALSGVNRGSKLASQLLAFGRRQTLEPKVVNIGRFVATMGDMLRRTIGEAIEIETIRSSGLWNTFVDPAQIENAILNLALNARDAMNGSGKLTIEVGNAFIDEDYARRHVDVEPGQYVMLAVTDTGGGMTQEIIDKVFEPFFSTKPVGKGTGLGLSMVYGFVKQSGGHVKVYSEVGHGTTVRLYLPRSARAEDRLADLDYGPTSGGTETILVAEDDEDVRATVVEMLGDLGYRVLKARDASSALSIIESGVPIDLLFTDVVMPGPLKSAELARQAKERLPDIAVLFTSGYTENSIVHEGRLDAGIELLSKPYSREALARRIRHLLSNRRQLKRKPSRQNDGRGGLQTARPLTILLVEDEMLIRMDIAEMLQGAGHEITEAGTAEEALRLSQSQHFDLLVTDLGLPDISGDALATMLRERDPAIGVIFATGEGEVPPLAVGPKPVLLRKPYDREALLLALSAARA
ncbi:PAS domain S-box protein [Rhizobium sp. BK251]|uniref:PAS domain S-box protein n=1 Tax=Rhizobium sp. BK251 TaxID=2512125 RepID=UPI0010520FAF|nr:PAS domain S-box protein [Rhizobium sp. BK251]TCL71135.1 PAS domain S-box-containing protein [Rhizobium sp. BK251]